MTDKKRKKYDFGGYIDTIANPEASMQQDVFKAAAKTADLNNSVWLQGLDVLGNTLIDAGVNGFLGAVGAEIGAGTLGKGGLLSKQPKGVTSRSQFEKAKQDRLNTNTQQTNTNTQQDPNTQQGKRPWTKWESLANVGAQFGGGLLKTLPNLFAQGGIAGEEENIEHVPIEAEGGEMIAMPWDNQAMPIQGASHENGGVDLNVPVGSKIYSKRVKDAKGKSMAYRKERRDRELKKWEKIVKDDPNNQIAKDTLEKVRRNNEIEEANDMAYMQLHKTKKQFSDYIKDVTKDYGKGGGLNIAAARQAIDQHNMQPVEGEREQYFTGSYVKPKLPDYPYLGKWNTLHPSQQPLTIDTVKKYISSRLPGFNFNGLFNSDPTQGTLTPEQEKYFWEELVPYLDDYTYKYDPNKIISDAKKADINKKTGNLNITNPKQANVNQDKNFNLGKYQNAIQDNTDTPWRITQRQQNLANLGISNPANSNKINSTPTTPNYQALQYNQANYENALSDGLKGVDLNQFSDSSGSSTDSDVPPTIRQSRKTLTELGQLKTINHTIMETYPLEERLKEFSEWLSNPENRMKGALDIKPPVDNQAGNTSIDNKVKVTKKAKGGIGQSLRPAIQQDFNTLYNAIVHRDPTALALLQNINNQPSNNKPSVKVTPKGNKANTTNTTTQVTQQDIEELPKRLPETITMNGRSYNRDALLNMLTQNPLARLGLGQSISPNDVTSKGSGKGVSNKVQQKDISNVNPNDIDKLIQSGWNPLFGFTGGVPDISNKHTDNATNTANRYNPNNFSYSPDHMAAMLGFNKDAKTGKYYNPRTGQEISDSILSSFGTGYADGRPQQSNIVSPTYNAITEQDTTGQNPGATPLATVPSITTNTGENTNTNTGKTISVQPNAIGSGVNNTTPVVPNNTITVGGGNSSAVPAGTSYINGDNIDYKALTSDKDKFKSLTGSIAESIFRKANSIGADDDLTNNDDVKAWQVDIMTTINTASANGSTVPQLRAKLAKVLSKREIFSGQTDGKSKPLTDALDTIMSSLAVTGSKQGNERVQVNNNDLKEPKPPVKPEPFKANLPNPFGSEEEEDKFWENVASGMGNADNNTKPTSESGEDEKGDNTEEKPSLWSVLGGALNPSFSTQVAGIIHNMFKPMQAVSDNFKGKSQYRNFYRDYGKKSLLELDNMKDNIRQIRDQNLRELSNMQAATAYSNNNNARDINVARAMNLATLSQITDAANKAYADYASKNNDIHKLRVNTLTDIDSKVMEGDMWADQMNREMRDSFFANRLEADKAVGMGLQEIGRLINRERFIKELKKHYEEMERERKEAAANKNIKLKSVTTTTGTKTKK